MTKTTKKTEESVPATAPTPVAATPAVVTPAPVVEEKKTTTKKASTKKVVEPTTVTETLPAVTTTEAVQEGGEEEVSDGKLRYFKLIYGGKVCGRYCGRKPKQAANKAFSSIIKERVQTGGDKNGVVSNVEFSIRECTRGSKQKEYNYVGSREELKKPVEVELKSSGKKIVYKFQNKLQKAKVPETAAPATTPEPVAPVAQEGGDKKETKAKQPKKAAAEKPETPAKKVSAKKVKA